MTLLARIRRWFRRNREETDRVIERSRELNEQQAILTAVTGNWLRDRYTGQWEGNRDA